MERITQSISSGESDIYRNLCLATGVGSIMGFCVGGRLGARVAGKDHILANQLTTYKYKMQAHREYHSAVIDGFIRNGCRWGWRAGVFAGLYSATTTLMGEYRNKYDGLNYLVAGATTGAVYKVIHGFRGVIVGTIVGTLCSLPVAVISHAVIWMVPEDVKQKIDQLDREEKERRNQPIIEPWQRNLGLTEQMISQMENDLDVNESISERS